MKKLIKIGVLAVMGLTLASCGSPEAKKTTNSTVVPLKSSSTKTSTTSTKKDTEYTFKDGKVEINDLKITITDHKIINPGESGNESGEKPVIAFWYDTTNKTTKEISPLDAWTVVFTVIQDNDPNLVNKLKPASLPDEKFLDTQMAQIKENGTVSNAIAYELTDTVTPVTLKANKGIGGADLGSQDYAVK